MKPDQLTEKGTLRSRLNRSRSVSGRLPRLIMSDDFGRSLRANAIPPTQRTVRNYYYPKMPLDLQREVNEWAGPSEVKGHQLIKEIPKKYNERKHNLENNATFERRIKRNLDNLQVKILDALRTSNDGDTKFSFTYLTMLYNDDGDLLRSYAGAHPSAVRVFALPFNKNNFQVVFDFHINASYDYPRALFTIVPKRNLEEYKSIPTKEKVEKKLYDGMISSYFNGYEHDEDIFPERSHFRAIQNLEVSSRPNGVFVHEYVEALDSFPGMTMEDRQDRQETIEQFHPNRPPNNDDILSDPTVVTDLVNIFSKK